MLLGFLVLQGQQDLPGNLERQVRMAQMVNQDLKDLEDLPELQDHKVNPVHLDNKALLVHKE